MRRLFLLLIIGGCTSAFAQFQTKHNNLGDPLTEITDPSMMKQGHWRYFNLNGKLIREEYYKDNELQSRTYFTSGKPLNEARQDVRQTTLPAEFSAYHGEAIVNHRGKLHALNFYYGSPAPDSATSKLILRHLKKLAKAHTNTILTF